MAYVQLAVYDVQPGEHSSADDDPVEDQGMPPIQTNLFYVARES